MVWKDFIVYHAWAPRTGVQASSSLAGNKSPCFERHMSSLLGFVAPAPGLLELVHVCLSSPGSLDGYDDWAPPSGLIPTLQILHFSSPAVPHEWLLSSALGWWHCAPADLRSHVDVQGGSQRVCWGMSVGGKGSLCLGASPGSKKVLPWGRTREQRGSATVCQGLGPTTHPGHGTVLFLFFPSKQVDLVVYKPMSNAWFFSPWKLHCQKQKKKKEKQYFNKFESESFVFFFFFFNLKHLFKKSSEKFWFSVQSCFPGISLNFPYTTEHISTASPLKIVCEEIK